MTVYVECANPKVLAEHHFSHGRTSVQYESQVDAPGEWLPPASERRQPADFYTEKYRYRLVFPDPEAAGKGLAEYAQRLGAEVQYRSTWNVEPGGWVGLVVGESLSVADLFATGECRIVAPAAAPAEEPLPEPDVRQIAMMDPASFVTVRPALPEGVEPVAWSDRHGAWVLFARDIPDAWAWCDGEGGGGGGGVEFWDGPERPTRPFGFVLARPVPSPPEPETERVHWSEVLGRTLPDGREVIGVYMESDDRALFCNLAPSDEDPESGEDDVHIDTDAEGRVEVLTHGGER